MFLIRAPMAKEIASLDLLEKYFRPKIIFRRSPGRIGDEIMASVAFSVEMPIRFSHSDPAGIVYYPNYFDMFNGVIEDWFAGTLHLDYADQILRKRIGFPTVHAECDFFAPSRMGERLTYTLLIREIGRSSLKLTIHGHVGGQERLRGKLVLVVISLDSGKSMAIPDDLRERFEIYQAESRGWQLDATEFMQA